MKLMATPKTVDIDITNRCNLRCRHCYYYANDTETATELDAAEWLRFFRELNECSVLGVTLAGGEPFMREDIRQLLEGIIENRMRYTILSNGTLVTRDIAAFIASNRRCDTIQVSIDGSCPEVHDALRGPGSFTKAVRGIRLLQEYEVPVSVRVTVYRGNVDDLERVAALLIDDLGLPGFSTNAASHMGICTGHMGDVQLDTESRTKAMQKLFNLEKAYPGMISASAGPLADARHFAAMERSRRRGEGKQPGKGSLTGCGCVFSSLAVRADGVITPCTMLAQIELGRVNRDSLRDIWQNHPELANMRRRSGITLDRFEFCRGCDYIGYCTGNCPALSYSMLGLVDHPSPDACMKRFLESGGRLPDTTGPDLADIS